MAAPRALPLLLAAGLAFLPATPAFPGDRDGKPDAPIGTGSAADRILPEHQQAIDRGVEWLAGQQVPNGSFPTVPVEGNGNTKSADYATAVTSLATLAFLGAGHGLRTGRYREKVQRAVTWLLDAQSPSGFISFPGDTQSKMHGHGYATLALAEAYATAASPEDPGEKSTGTEFRNSDVKELRQLSGRLRKGIQAAVDCIEASQSTVGGWFYDPGVGGTNDHEGSVTVCQVQALLAASNRGFRVDLGKIKKARQYMKSSQASSGGFKYKLSILEGEGQRESWSLTAAGITTLIGLAEFDRKEALDRAFEFLDSSGTPRFHERDRISGRQYPLYGNFYATQAYHWLGGRRWEDFWGRRRTEILDRQRTQGNWVGQDTISSLGDVYPTAFCLLMLEVPVGYLSIYAR